MAQQSTQHKSALVASMIFMVVVCVAFVGSSFFAAATGDGFMAALMGVFAVYLGFAIVYALVTRAPARRLNPQRFHLGHTRSGEPATVAPTPTGTVAVALMMVAISASVAVTLLLLTVPGGPLPLLLAMLTGALPAATCVRALRGRLHRGHLACSPSEIEVQTWTSGVAAPWSEIAGIRVSDRTRNPVFVQLLLDDRDDADSAVRTWHPAGRMWRNALPTWDPHLRVVTITVEHTGIHRELLLALLAHYWHRSTQRGELANHSGLQRLQQHQLAPPTYDEPEPDPAEPEHPESTDPGENRPEPSASGADHPTPAQPTQARRVTRLGQLVAGLAGLILVAASTILLMAAQQALLADPAAAVDIRSTTVLVTLLTLLAAALTLGHALLRLARVPRPLATLAISTAITAALGGGYLAALALSLPDGAQLSPLWPVFVAGMLTFAVCARRCPAQTPRGHAPATGGPDRQLHTAAATRPGGT